MQRKERLTVTVDPELIAAGTAAVEAGRERAERDRKLVALDDAVAAYEARAGLITDEELREQQRTDRAAAVVVRGRRVE